MGALDRQVSVEDFRRLARRRLPKSIFEFIDGGAGQELTLNANRSDFEKIRLLPRVLTDVSHPNVSTTLWSETLPTPLVISPMGSCALARPGADIAIARAATARGIHPGWSLRLLRGGLPQFENVRGYLGDNSAGLTIAVSVGGSLHAGFDWDDFRQIRDWWKGRLLVKGVLHPGDASRLVAAGADGIWVSNHGGRQLDSAVSSIDALPAIRQALGAQVPILIDSGIRTGTDIIKAKARGATVAAIGRAALFGAVAGEAGVAKALDIILDEVVTCLRLCGIPRFQEAGSEIIA